MRDGVVERNGEVVERCGHLLIKIIPTRTARITMIRMIHS